MKIIHNIEITVFAKENNDKDLIKECLEVFLPENGKKEDFFSVERACIDENSSIDIIKFKCLKQRDCKLVLGVLKDFLGEDQLKLICSQEDRVDENGRGYLRLLKQPFIESHKAIVTDCGDCVHIKLLLACYPCNKENAWKVFKEIFSCDL
jgi:RNA binding exosome subunit